MKNTHLHIRVENKDLKIWRARAKESNMTLTDWVITNLTCNGVIYARVKK